MNFNFNLNFKMQQSFVGAQRSDHHPPCKVETNMMWSLFWSSY